jgi:hypothetical protein
MVLGSNEVGWVYSWFPTIWVRYIGHRPIIGELAISPHMPHILFYFIFTCSSLVLRKVGLGFKKNFKILHTSILAKFKTIV